MSFIVNTAKLMMMNGFLFDRKFQNLTGLILKMVTNGGSETYLLSKQVVKTNFHGRILPLTPQGVVTGLGVINCVAGQGIADSSALAELHPALCHGWHSPWGFSAYNFLIGYKLTLNYTKKLPTQIVRSGFCLVFFFPFPYRCHLTSFSRYNFLIKIKLIKK